MLEVEFELLAELYKDDKTPERIAVPSVPDDP